MSKQRISTIKKYQSSLNQLISISDKDRCFKDKDYQKIRKESKLSFMTLSTLVDIGYVEKIKNGRDVKYKFKVLNFEPIHVRNLVSEFSIIDLKRKKKKAILENNANSSKTDKATIKKEKSEQIEPIKVHPPSPIEVFDKKTKEQKEKKTPKQKTIKKEISILWGLFKFKIN